MALELRAPAAEDVAAWRRLFLDYIAFYGAEVPTATIELTWRRLLGEEDGMFGFLAIAEGRPAGLVHAVVHRSTWSATWYCYLEDLFVDPALRGRGVGRALIERIYRESDARGCTRTYWMTQEANEAARRLYDSLATRAPFVQYRRL